MLKQFLATIALFASFLMMAQPVLAVTTGQVNYYDEETGSSGTSSTASSSTATSQTETTDVTQNKHVPKPTPTNQGKPNLLQTNDVVNYFFSLVGVVLILIGVYEIRKLKTFRRNSQ